ncbi:MAG: peptidylprolyl isomerase [Actinomycetota bacterium]|nr:peptidylprolyl isomerase [Actinomycetota bacterium]
MGDRRLPVAAALALVIALVVALAACGGGGAHGGAAAQATSQAVSTETARATSTDANGCAAVTPPAAKAKSEPKPTKRLDPAKTYDVKIETNCGSFTIRLAVKTSPVTTASFVSLTQKGFFDSTVFHRIVPGFLIQGGDPTGTGRGGPGYSTVEAPPATTRYILGLVAMAKTQAEAPGTSGSQFFVVTAQDAQLPPNYAVLGHITDGKDTISRISGLGDPSTQQPTETVEIEHATVSSH